MEEFVSNKLVIFLGSSQTFLGVLTTIVVLCIFKRGNNFIEKILIEVNNKLVDTIANIGSMTNIFDTINSVKQQNDNYKFISHFISNYSNDSNPTTRDLFNKAAATITKIELARNQLQYKDLNLLPKLKISLQNIANSRESYTSPLYVFIFCIVLFVYDELFTNTKISRDFLVTSLSLINLLSYMLLCLSWGNYIIKLWPNRNIKEIQASINDSRFLRGGYLYLLIGVIIILTLFAPQILFNSVIIKVFLSTIIIVPCLLKGIHKFHINKGIIKYYDIFIVSHIMKIIALSLIISLIFVNFDGYLQPMSFYYSNLYLLKISSIIFVLLFGIIFPFFFPWLMYYIYYLYVKIIIYVRAREVKKINKKLVKEMAEIIQHLSEVSKYF